MSLLFLRQAQQRGFGIIPLTSVLQNAQRVTQQAAATAAAAEAARRAAYDPFGGAYGGAGGYNEDDPEFREYVESGMHPDDARRLVAQNAQAAGTPGLWDYTASALSDFNPHD